MSETKLSADQCRTHEGGEHCWHSYGNTGYSGRYQTSTPVKCCHCGAKAKLIEFSPSREIIYEEKLR